MKTIYFLLAIMAVTACTEPTRELDPEIYPVKADSVQVKPSFPYPLPVDSSHMDSLIPDLTLLAPTLLVPGVYHKDEVNPGVQNSKWAGLFYKNGQYYLEQTELVATRVFDAIVDEVETKKTGWAISVSSPDSCIVLIRDFSVPNRRIVPHAPIPQVIKPLDTARIAFPEATYILWTHGLFGNSPIDSSQKIIKEYRLLVTGKFPGNTVLQDDLVFQPEFYENMVRVLFAGDINADGYLDLLIDNSNHYNVKIPTLYLSNEFEKLPRPVAYHKSVGS